MERKEKEGYAAVIGRCLRSSIALHPFARMTVDQLYPDPPTAAISALAVISAELNITPLSPGLRS
jgi:hypothetical protein